MKGKIFIDSNKIINWIPENETGDMEGTKLAMDVMGDLLEEHGTTSLLVDLSKAQRPNTEQRGVIIQKLRDTQSKIKKIALFGESALMKAVSFFVINTAGFDNIKFFANRAQATQWLLKHDE